MVWGTGTHRKTVSALWAALSMPQAAYVATTGAYRLHVCPQQQGSCLRAWEIRYRYRYVGYCTVQYPYRYRYTKSPTFLVRSSLLMPPGPCVACIKGHAWPRCVATKYGLLQLEKLGGVDCGAPVN